ncbi:hypothetical protein COCCU_13215 [Corynebacterium occultum]|uniref:Phosphotyrosine protein phosphatase I domain-containing protein n=1 Tax=Corynebacterium occultum TaxID=2675219 RepID=A0A6B8VSH2_9CORY|nr:hypothetical protein [Corynebacterium occultum]QGU08542.1 hypothetical protein COCCU_13215 [Corynebacterium occultum]
MMIKKFETVRQDLYRRYGHACAPTAIDSILEGVIAEHTSTAKIPNFLAVFIARDAAELIEDHIWASGRIGTPRKRIHFSSAGSPSQAAFAAAAALKLSDQGVIATADAVHPENPADLKLEWVLDERGLEAPQRRLPAKGERALEVAEVVVLMGAEDAPDFPGRRHVRWDLQDDLDVSLEDIRDLCDDIEMKVFDLLLEMGIPLSAHATRPMLAA